MRKVFSTLGVGLFYDRKSPKKNGNVNTRIISTCSENGMQVAHTGSEEFHPSRRNIVVLYQDGSGKGGGWRGQ